MNRTFSFLIAFLLIFSSCSKTPKTDLITIDILDGLKNEKEFRLSEIVDDVEYIKLETTPDCLFSWASFQVGKKYIIVVQSYNPAQIFLFDRTGRFLRKIGGEGKGPMEYTSLSTVAADPDETYILVNDYQRDVIMKYDFQGNVTTSYNYKEQLDGDVAGIVIKSTDEVFLRLDYPRLEKKNFYLIRKVDGKFQQMDSLYPVTTTNIEGSSFAWGSSDFYVQNGSIQFRQFSIDTLFGESRGKLIPRFYFPITADHLPGPYLVGGLHKQMYDYSSIPNISELPGWLILNARIAPRKGGNMLYNKSTGELSLLKKYPPCPPDTLGRRVFLNDIDGMVHPLYFSTSNGLFVNSHQVIDLKDKTEEICPEVSALKFPAKRKEFIALINLSKEEDNPILQIFHLK